MLRSDSLGDNAPARYAFVILVSLIVLLFAHARAAGAETTDSAGSAATYLTTVNLLNVREAPNAQARIVKVVKQGTVLKADATVNGGWLKLSGGAGYVNGAYARLVAAAKPAAAVKTLSYTVAAAAGSGSGSGGGKPAATAAAGSAGSTGSASGGGKPAATAISVSLPLSEVESASGLTADAIELLFGNTELLGHGLEKAILAIEEDYGINAFFTIAVMKLESGNGTSKLADRKNNLFGLSNGKGGYLSFKTKADSVRRFGKLISDNYIGDGYSTIEDISGKYCPPNKDWPTLIRSIMKRDYKRLLGESA
ncbi:glucosaminidase domain-containing protein [Cohnella fermenti]|uniref:SH3b domain-containing protein n=1 Tax=Cohnella fermenti TaxID=2565925 RepID=A0A4S4C4G1_9BACL|nr:glucosaminidase domain-containing protein [Cohnella fermenti]THF82697.1 hypothetical protein E6C55_06415 [Cohnella fermenti]